MQFEMHGIQGITISDERMFQRGLLLAKRKICTHFYEKKLDEIYTGEIHVLAKMCKAAWIYIYIYTVPLGLLPDYVVFYKIHIIEI